MQLPEIIGIAGTNASGKDTLADLRAEKQGARKISLSNILRIEATARGFDTLRGSLSEISTEYARQFGPAHLAELALRDFVELRTPEQTGLSIVSVRRPAEAGAIQEAGGLLVWVDADQEQRHRRVQDAKRGRAEDEVSFEVFKAQEEAEMNPEDPDPYGLNMGEVEKMADLKLWNDAPSEKQYKQLLVDLFELYK
jgi:dephospho-CoA kinase